MLGRLHHVVLDCPDPAALARFYSELLGQPITYRGQDWVVVAASDTTWRRCLRRPRRASVLPDQEAELGTAHSRPGR